MFLSRPNEKLETHTDNVLKYFNLLNKKINYKNLSEDVYEEKIEILFNLVPLYHDEGKKNLYFQETVKGIHKWGEGKREHSKLSTVKYLNDMVERFIKSIEPNGLKGKREKNLIGKIIINLSYNILKHHSGLDDKPSDKEYINSLIQHYNKYKDSKYKYIDMNVKNLEYLLTLNTDKVSFNNPIEAYFLFKLNYSMLVQADFMAVYEFKNKKCFELKPITNNIKHKIKNNFYENEIVSGIYEYKKGNNKLSEINKYRSDIFLESENNIIKNKDGYIYYLEAPTGAGKSTIGINLALKLIDDIYNKIIYVSPLNNITEQMYNSTKNKLKTNEFEMVIINNRECIRSDDKYEENYLSYQTLNYPIVMTSHVKLFNILFGTNRNDLLALNSLRNSVLILDEIQNYNNKNWINQINSLYYIAKLYNIKIIIMSATLPKMDKLLDNDINRSELIDLVINRDRYYNYFKNRVSYDFSLIEDLKINEKNKKEEVVHKIEDVITNTDKHRILIENISVKSCESLYSELKKYEKDGFLVFKMLSATNSEVRKNIIGQIQEKNPEGMYKNNKIILIGTQCLEAGIDIDMQIGFKDISLLDADEQFIGRLNRNFKETAICYFYDLDKDEYIYKEDYRAEYNLKTSKEYRDCFLNKNFNTYYNNNYNWLIKKQMDNYNEFKKNMNELQYNKIKENMKLIDNDTYTFIFNTEYFSDKGNIKANDLLLELDNLNKSNVSFAEKKIKQKEIMSKLNIFTYTLNTYYFKEKPIYEYKNGYYIVDKGFKNYFDNLNNGMITNSSNLDIDAFSKETNIFT